MSEHKDRGWECPKCHRIWASWVGACDMCNSEFDTLKSDADTLRKLWRVATAANAYMYNCDAAHLERLDHALDALHGETPHVQRMSFSADNSADVEAARAQAAADRALAEAVRGMPKGTSLVHLDVNRAKWNFHNDRTDSGKAGNTPEAALGIAKDGNA